MDLDSKLARLLLEARKKLRECASSESPEELTVLIQVIKECEAAGQQLKRLEEVYMRLKDALNRGRVLVGHAGILSETAMPAQHRSDTTSRSERAGHAERTRHNFLNTLHSEGISLYGVRGKRLYRTESGKRVAICYASEDKRGDLWWMGLPNEQIDILVALCRRPSGETFDFVLPQDFLREVRFSQEQQRGQLEFHIKRSGPNFEVNEAAGRHINRFLHAYDLLR
jgi:hypothetical protein